MKIPESQDRITTSAIIGANGSGKSRLLGEIARCFISGEYGSPELNGGQIDINEITSVLAISNIAIDSFPFPSKLDQSYRYLGLRRAANAVFSGTVKTIIDNNLFYILNLRTDLIKNLNNIFKYLNITDCRSTLRIIDRKPIKYPDPKQFKTNFENRLGFHNPEYNDYAIGEIYNVLIKCIDEINNIPSVRTNQKEQFYDLQNEAEGNYLNQIAINFMNILSEFKFTVDQSVRVMLRYLNLVPESEFEIKNEISTGKLITSQFSAGQQLLIATCLRVLNYVRNNSLILIDEPETGLHPEWELKFIDIVKDIIPENYNVHMVIATHSPYVASNADAVIYSSTPGVFDNYFSGYEEFTINNILYSVFNTPIFGNYGIYKDLELVTQWISQSKINPVLNSSVTSAVNRLKNTDGESSMVVQGIIKEYESAVINLNEEL
ncbi:AAA family ATPase [Rothia kristinae]|uniref:AAA family ATPase n=1 Tax=Rothia kristinae TaxID=37923 RepID=UPI0013F4E7E1|nr:ATP-binding protein [Rothia kristinae]